MLICQDCGKPIEKSASDERIQCGRCWRMGILTVRNGFTPSRTVGAGQIDPAASKEWDGELAEYAAARAEGIQPATTRRKDIQAAKAFSDEMGVAFDAGQMGRMAEGIADQLTEEAG